MAEIVLQNTATQPAKNNGPRAAADPITDYMQNIAWFNTDAGRILGIESTNGNPNDNRLAPGRQISVKVNGIGLREGPEVSGITGKGELSLGNIAVIFSPQNIAPQTRVTLNTAQAANLPVTYGKLTSVNENEIRLTVPDRPPGVRNIDNAGTAAIGYMHVVRRDGNNVIVYPGQEVKLWSTPQFEMLPLKPGAIPAPAEGSEPIADQRAFANPVMRNLLPARATHSDDKLVLPSDPAAPDQDVTVYVSGLANPNSASVVRLSSGLGAAAGKNFTQITTSSVTETEPGSGIYKVTFRLPSAADMKERDLLLPDHRGKNGSETYDESFAQRAVINWNPNRADAGQPAAGTGMIIAFDSATAAANTATFSKSYFYFLPATAGSR